jgi:beta-N-acetylhexosaminidase
MQFRLTALILLALFCPAVDSLSDETLRERVGQMFVIGFRGTEIDENSYAVKTVNALNIGGVVLFDYDVPSQSFPRNIINPEQTGELVADLKALTDGSLLICVDAEGGKVNRLKPKYGFTDIPGAEYCGSSNDPELTKQIASLMASQLHDLGIDLNFAPVVDVNVNPENPVIGALGRSFSGDPDVVSAHAKAFIQAHDDFQVLTCVKHFPGHGSSSSDSHYGMVDVTETYREDELKPYRSLIGDGKIRLVMTAHIFDRNIDPDCPATLSPRFIKGILRDGMGFDGVVVSDDMHMGAISEHFSFEESIVLAINAGCDILVLSNNNRTYDELSPYRAVDAVLKAVSEGRITKERIDEAYQRVSELKKNHAQRRGGTDTHCRDR